MKQEKIMLILIPILSVVLIALAYFKVIGESKNATKDSIKFKDEYEAINNTKNASGKTYKKLDIDKSNPIKYSNYDELLDIIENKTGIIYLGFPDCPWCRTAIPVLFETAKDNKIDTIYYLNIKSERDFYVVENGELAYNLDDNGTEMKGTEGYFKLLDALSEHLSDYVIEFEGRTYEVGEKRIYAPSVIFVRDGEILGIQVSTIESQIDPYESLTKEQHDELYDIYNNYIKLMKSDNSCSVGTSC